MYIRSAHNVLGHIMSLAHRIHPRTAILEVGLGGECLRSWLELKLGRSTVSSSCDISELSFAPAGAL